MCVRQDITFEASPTHANASYGLFSRWIHEKIPSDVLGSMASNDESKLINTTLRCVDVGYSHPASLHILKRIILLPQK